MIRRTNGKKILFKKKMIFCSILFLVSLLFLLSEISASYCNSKVAILSLTSAITMLLVIFNLKEQ